MLISRQNDNYTKRLGVDSSVASASSVAMSTILRLSPPDALLIFSGLNPATMRWRGLGEGVTPTTLASQK